MFRRSLKPPAFAAAVFTVAACAPLPTQQKDEPVEESAPSSDSGGLGALAMGGLLGGAAGSNVSEPSELPVEGAFLGGPFAPFLSRSDVERAHRTAMTAFEALPSGQTKIWRNPENGHWGTLTPARTYRNAEGRYCREYRQTVTIGGQEHQANGAVCRRGDGVWQVIS